MFSDQGEVLFVEKKKKEKKSDFIYLLSWNNRFAAKMQALALTLAYILPYSPSRYQFELGANIDVTKKNPTWCLSHR